MRRMLENYQLNFCSHTTRLCVGPCLEPSNYSLDIQEQQDRDERKLL
jgi:hypothetical protein